MTDCKYNGQPSLCFWAEKPLGKLAKWLRLLGFDTLYEADHAAKSDPHQNRILLTRSRKIDPHSTWKKIIYVESDHPFEQLRKVIHAIRLTRNDIESLIFKRCSVCNLLLQTIDKDRIRQSIPEYVWGDHDVFYTCNRCMRIYWPGTHMDRAKKKIESLFETGKCCRKNGSPKPHGSC